MTELPPGWAVATIGSLVASDGVFTDGDWVETKDQDPNGDVRLIQLADVGNGVFRDRSSRFLTGSKAEQLGCMFLEPDDVLIARMPDPLGRACMFPGVGQPSVTAVDVCIVRPGAEGADPRWLVSTVNSPQFRAEVTKLQAGTTRKRISRKNLATIRFPVPPSNEQRRIVAAIEEQFSRLDAAENSLDRAERRLGTLRAAVFTAATAGHDPVELGDLVIDLRYGTSTKCHYDGEGPPVLRIPNVQSGRIDTSDLKFAADPTIDLSSYFVEPDDLLFVRTNGSRDLIGRVGTVGEAEGMAFASYLIRARLDRSRLDPKFGVIALSAPLQRELIESKAATTAGQYNLNLAALRSLPVPLPPLDEQFRIVAEAEKQLSVIDAMRDSVGAAKGRSTALRRAILERAFRGELAPQDPSDEPASVLLERIAAGRDVPPTARKRVRAPA